MWTVSCSNLLQYVIFCVGVVQTSPALSPSNTDDVHLGLDRAIFLSLETAVHYCSAIQYQVKLHCVQQLVISDSTKNSGGAGSKVGGAEVVFSAIVVSSSNHD